MINLTPNKIKFNEKNFNDFRDKLINDLPDEYINFFEKV